MLQVISHHQSINQSNLNGRLIVHLDRSNILHLFSYWRPEISEDLSVSMCKIPCDLCKCLVHRMKIMNDECDYHHFSSFKLN